MNAIILAAGSGKRIREDVKDLPKSFANGKWKTNHCIPNSSIETGRD